LSGNGFSAVGASVSIGSGVNNIVIENMNLGSGGIDILSSNNIVSNCVMGNLMIRNAHRNQILGSQVLNNSGSEVIDLGQEVDQLTPVYSTCNYFEGNIFKGVGNRNTRFVHLLRMLSNTFVGNTFQLDNAVHDSNDNSILVITYGSYFNEFRSNKFYLTVAPAHVADGPSGDYQGAGVRMRDSSSFNQFIDNEFRCNCRRCLIMDRGTGSTSLPRDNVFSGNRIYDTYDTVWAYGLLDTSSGNNFANNLFYSQTTKSVYTDYLNQVQANFTNNTFVAPGGNAFWDDTSGAKKLVFRNNIIYSQTSPAFSPSTSPIDFSFNALTSTAASVTSCQIGSGSTPVATPIGCNIVGNITFTRHNQIGLDPTTKDGSGHYIVDPDGLSFVPVGAQFDTFGEGGAKIGYRPSSGQPVDILPPASPANLAVH